MNTVLLTPFIYTFCLLFVVFAINRLVEYRTYIKMSKDKLRAGKYMTSAIGWLFLAITLLAIGFRL